MSLCLSDCKVRSGSGCHMTVIIHVLEAMRLYWCSIVHDRMSEGMYVKIYCQPLRGDKYLLSATIQQVLYRIPVGEGEGYRWCTSFQTEIYKQCGVTTECKVTGHPL